ncbi:glutaminase A [Nocardioides sp. zg-536]|uniref:Glutaminase n=1 Tax=Nocardioides faecalis TaxID=2803858 RepID=A0A938Y6H7_9ACTN|nr:glutaminase A [Nocardioides faecalis]MBM9460160.1 glutaminase A [Nocardioides faecalis]MBS4754259.1 glutaminase A [Nocardioides faecalis]QVI60045.1 glutaminase A [Nocardioides faecalis]
MSTPGSMSQLLDRVRADLLADTSGEVSPGNPLLADAETDRFALAVVDPHDGTVHATEDAEHHVTIQSVAKPWTYAVALLDHGEQVHERIGVEPTGEPFDALVLESQTGRPPNAMVNAGALVAASLVRGGDVDERVERVLDVCSRAAGRPLAVDEEMARHELEHGDRNRALGYLMHDSGALACDVDAAVEVLARVCSISVTATDLATMAATLAGWGRRPGATGDSGEDQRVLPEATVIEVLSVMATCGMYDGAGRWAHRVGIPAKSGVSGALLALAPGRLGIGAWSAPLDDHGNSLRGVRACEALSTELGLHRFAPPR